MTTSHHPPPSLQRGLRFLVAVLCFVETSVNQDPKWAEEMHLREHVLLMSLIHDVQMYKWMSFFTICCKCLVQEALKLTMYKLTSTRYLSFYTCKLTTIYVNTLLGSAVFHLFQWSSCILCRSAAVASKGLFGDPRRVKMNASDGSHCFWVWGHPPCWPKKTSSWHDDTSRSWSPWPFLQHVSSWDAKSNRGGLRVRPSSPGHWNTTC